MRDRKDNVVIICSIENLDPMGVHTGDSITVAPAQTLTDKEYQIMRDAAIAIIREIGVETGGSNIQFAVNPEDGRMVVIEMNPRVSRSSALASARRPGSRSPRSPPSWPSATPSTRFPTTSRARRRRASSRPSTTWSPRSRASPSRSSPARRRPLGTQMKSVGEAMAIGRTFKESLQKALRSLEIDSYGFDDKGRGEALSGAALEEKLRVPNAQRIWYVAEAFRAGMDTAAIFELSRIDPWFLDNIRQIVEAEKELSLEPAALRRAKEMGFADLRLAQLLGVSEEEVRQARMDAGIRPVYKTVDTCGAEFEALTRRTCTRPTSSEDESGVTERKKIMILGGGPNRIGQGIEFDYCCVHAAFALEEAGFETSWSIATRRR
jgi:carbamoyl-phosphate synthase large subunit